MTSLNDKQIQKYYFKNRVNLVIEKYVKYAIDKKLDGIVCSPHEIKIVKKTQFIGVHQQKKFVQEKIMKTIYNLNIINFLIIKLSSLHKF